jgi:hypothetical protein
MGNNPEAKRDSLNSSALATIVDLNVVKSTARYVS